MKKPPMAHHGAAGVQRFNRVAKSAMAAGFAVFIIFAAAAICIYLYSRPHVPLAAPSSLDAVFNATAAVLSNASSSRTYGVYLATTLPQWEQGYMNQTSLGDCRGASPCLGMLFVFSNFSDQCFWMKNTIMPLRQAWLDPNGIVLYVYNATPQSQNVVCANGEMVLETSINQSLAPGDRLELRPT